VGRPRPPLLRPRAHRQGGLSASALLSGAVAPVGHRGPPTFAPIRLAASAPAPPARKDYVNVFMPPSDGVERSRRFAYALVEPASAAPGVLLRRALDELGGTPHVGLAASDFGSLLVVSSS
jgi:hypothetical protein